MTSPDDALSPLVVLVHGAWHGAWCWATLQRELDARGIASLAVDLPGHGTSVEPLTGLHGDAEALGKMLDAIADRFERPIVLVGHSYGGAVITQAAAGRTDIAHLLYIAAFALDDGESVLGALSSFDRRDVALSAAMLPTADGTSSVLDPTTAPAALYGDCPPAAIPAALARLSGQTFSSMTEAIEGDPRSSIPSTYVVCSRDAAVHPDHQRVMADRCNHVATLDTDHSPFLSAVDDTAKVLDEIVVGLAR